MSQRGQATLELLLVVCVLAAVAAGAAQGLLYGWASVEAVDAARAGARATALGADGGRTARAALPVGLRRGAAIESRAGFRVVVRVPALVPGVDLRATGWVG